MKKITLVLFLLCSAFFLCSCGKKTISDPGEISVNGKTIKYSYEKDQVEKKIGDGDKTDFPGNSEAYEYDGNLTICYNDEDNIRYMKVEDDDIITFKNICVGDDIDDVLDKFEYETGNSHMYSVYFDGTKEVKPKAGQSPDNNWITITYYSGDNDNVEGISIMDMEYAKFMR